VVATDGASLNPKNRGFEDQSEPFPYSFQGIGSGKILSLLKTPKLPLIGMVILTFFLVLVISKNPASIRTIKSTIFVDISI